MMERDTNSIVAASLAVKSLLQVQLYKGLVPSPDKIEAEFRSRYSKLALPSYGKPVGA
jgi:hypothetical protein